MCMLFAASIQTLRPIGAREPSARMHASQGVHRISWQGAILSKAGRRLRRTTGAVGKLDQVHTRSNALLKGASVFRVPGLKPKFPTMRKGSRLVEQSGSKTLRNFDPLELAPVLADLPAALEPERVALALRNATAARHRILESALPLASLPLEAALYGRALAGFEVFLQAWEPRIRSALPLRLHGWLTTRSRYELVRADIERLRCERTRLAASLKKACVASVDGIELRGACAIYAAFGSMYVMEGSALGGQVIAKVARDSLGIHARNGGAYFTGHGAATAAGWRSFLGLLEAEVGCEPLPRSAACKAAEQTFDALIRIFTLLRDDSALR